MKVTRAMLDAAQASLPALNRQDLEVAIQAALDAEPTIRALVAFAGHALLSDIKAVPPDQGFDGITTPPTMTFLPQSEPMIQPGAN